jgi:CBS domain-containing protein
MTTGKHRHVVVVDDGHRPLGVVSLGDLVEDGVRPSGGLTVEQSIRRPLTTVTTMTSARQAAAIMTRYGMGCLPVVDSDGALVSIVTRIDIARALSIDLREAARRDRDEAPYSYRKRLVGLTWEQALDAVRSGLASEGFSVIGEVPISDTLREKVGSEIGSYRIFLACNPVLADAALTSEHELGLLLPCHVIVYDRGDGIPIAAAIEPRALLGIVRPPKDELLEIAEKTELRLRRAIDVARGFSERLASADS